MLWTSFKKAGRRVEIERMRIEILVALIEIFPEGKGRLGLFNLSVSMSSKSLWMLPTEMAKVNAIKSAKNVCAEKIQCDKK